MWPQGQKLKEEEGGSALRKACPQVPDVFTLGKKKSFLERKRSVDLWSSAEKSGYALMTWAKQKGTGQKRKRIQENTKRKCKALGR